MEMNGDERNYNGKFAADEMSGTANCGEDDFNELYMVLHSIVANLDQLAENCCDVHDRLNQLELDCIDLLQPIGDIISLERELKRLSEIESNYMNVLSKNDNN